MTYSARVSGSICIGETALTLAKTNGLQFALSEPSRHSFAAGTKAVVSITVDDETDSREVLLPHGIQTGQQFVKYTSVQEHP